MCDVASKKVIRVFYLVIICSIMLQIAAFAAELSGFAICLGVQNKSANLFVPSSGDGKNIPVTIQGVSARRSLDPYMYIGVIPSGTEKLTPQDLYVTVEILDDTFALVRLEFDQAAGTPNIESKYTASTQEAVLTGTNKWITQTYYLPKASLSHGQNGNTDFRLCSKGIAVRRITVSSHRPPGFVTDSSIDPAVARKLQIQRRQDSMEVTIGNDATLPEASLLKNFSVSSIESYVDWAGVEPIEGVWDWSAWDRQVEILKKAGLKWVPFLIAGSAYSTPMWFQKSKYSHNYRCLEHGKDSKVQSLFNPELPGYIDRYLKAFASRYRDQGVIESVLLGISGIYGESIYPAGPEGGWTARLSGDYHNHEGWWGADTYATAAFRSALQKKHFSISALNRTWKTSYISFSDISTFLPDKAPSEFARIDLVEWYQQAMTDWAVYWVKTARKYFPNTEIYLATGGNGDPRFGADFTAQVAAISREHAGVRITNEGSDYATNFALTREVASATRFYNTFSGFEPGSSVNETGIIARIYNATTSGARQLHDYDSNFLGSLAALNNFRANAAMLTLRKPRIKIAQYLSRETWALDPAAISKTYSISKELRDINDLDFVTRRSILDGYLRTHSVLVVSNCSVLEPKVADAIERWVKNGGILIVSSDKNMPVGGRVYDLNAWRARMLSRTSIEPSELFLTQLDGPPPSHWVLNVGMKDDDTWLIGDWHEQESALEWPGLQGARKRWSGARPIVQLPTSPGADYILKIALNVPSYALDNVSGEVLINGRPVGHLHAGLMDLELRVPQTVLGKKPLATLEFTIRAWKPSDKGSVDTRDLGIGLRKVEWTRSGSEKITPAQAKLRTGINPSALETVTRKVELGRTIHLTGFDGEPVLFAQALAAVLGKTVDGKLDKRYVTETSDGYLWYDAVTSEIKRVKSR